MKPNFTGAFRAVVVCLATLATASAELIDTSAKIVGLRGMATDANGAALKTGDTLKTGGVVKTGADSFVDLLFSGKGISSALIRVKASSELSLTKLVEYHFDQGPAVNDPYVATQLELKEGSLLANVKKHQAGRFELKTPAGVTGIRGTAFSQSADGSIMVVEGEVETKLIFPNGKAMILRVPQGRHLKVTAKLINAAAAGLISAEDILLMMGLTPDEVYTAFHSLHSATNNALYTEKDVPPLLRWEEVVEIVYHRSSTRKRNPVAPATASLSSSPAAPAPAAPAASAPPAPNAPAPNH